MEHQPTDERRAQITAALLRVMAEHGYEKATVAKIAREAELTPGLLHYHFNSKQQILLTLLDEITSAELAALRVDGPPQERLDAIVERLLATGEGARPEVVSAWVVASAEAIRQPAVRHRFAAAVSELAAIVADVVEAGVADGTWTASRPTAEIAAAFVAMVQGYYTLAATARELVPRSSAAPAARALLGALLPRGS